MRSCNSAPVGLPLDQLASSTSIVDGLILAWQLASSNPVYFYGSVYFSMRGIGGTHEEEAQYKEYSENIPFYSFGLRFLFRRAAF